MRHAIPFIVALALAGLSAAPAPTPTPAGQRTFYSISTGELLGPWPSPTAYPLPWFWTYPIACRGPVYVYGKGHCRRRVRPLPSPKHPPKA